MFKKLLSVLLAVMMVVSVMAVGVVNTAAATTDGFTPESTKLYFDTEGTGWDMSTTRDKVAFHIFGGDLGTEANPTAGLKWGARQAIGTATSGESGVFEIDPAAKLGITLTPGVQYKIIFVHTNGSNWKEQTYDLLFTTDCLGHVAYSDGSTYENPVDSSKKTTAAFWRDMDATKYGPVLQISSIGNVVGTCPEAGKTPESIFTDFLTVVDSVTNVTTYANAYHYMVESGNKTDQQLIDDIGAGLGLTKDQVQAAFTDNEVETTWSFDASTLPEAHKHTPGEPVQENVVPATFYTEGSYDEVIYCTECNEEISRESKTIDKVTPDANKLYFDTNGTGWEMGTKNKVAFHIFGGDIENGLQWGASKSIGNATEGQPGVFEVDPANGKQGYTLNPGVQYKIIFVRTDGRNWKEQTYDLLFTTDCLGHIAYCDGTEYENPVDSSKKTLAAFWKDMDATEVGPVLQISSIGNVVGTCPEAGKTPASIFTDFLTVVDSVTGTTTYVNAKKYVVEPGTKTDQQLIDDIGTGLGLTKQQVYDAFTNNSVETTWDYTVSTLPGEVVPAHTHTPGEPVQENVVPASCTAEGSYDEVVYCTGCNEELSREHKTIDKLAHTPGEAVRENEVPASCKAEGSYDEVVYCTECNEELSRETKTIDKLAHTPGEPVQENVDPASCTAEGSYDEVVYCTECGEKLSQTHKTIDKLAHTPGGEVIENREVTHDYIQYEVVHYCTDCNIELSRETVQEPIITHTLTYVPEVPATEEAEGTKAHYTCSGCDKLFSDAAGTVEVTEADLVIPKLTHTHTPGEPVQENVVPASCSAEGSYDVVVYCTSCNAEISREHKTIDKLAHTLTYKAGKKATEEADGWQAHFVCTECKKYFADGEGQQEITWEQIVIPKLTHVHTPGEPVQENVVPASCSAEGSYDEVVYCTSCNAELSREHKTIDKLAHTPGTAVQENVVPASCSAEGSYDEVVYCTSCNAELSREHKTIDKLAHTPGQAVQENVVPASCSAEGSYDEVVYCTECQAELSREHKTIDKTAHTIMIRPGQAATTEADGWNTHFYCTECNKLFTNATGTNETTWEAVRIPRIVTGKLGDIDGDGIVTILDVTVIQRVLAYIKPADDKMKKLGDVDGDGKITALDATKLQRWLLGLNQDLNIGEDV